VGDKKLPLIEDSLYGKDPEELKNSSNPFSLAVLAGIYASKSSGKSKKEEEKRFIFKQELINLALQKYAHKGAYLSALLYFIDYLLQIPSELEERLTDEPIEELRKEEVKIMGMERLRDTPTFGRLLRNLEEEAIKKGLEQGKREGKEEGKQEAEKEFAQRLLKQGLSDDAISNLTNLKLEEIKELRKSFEN